MTDDTTPAPAPAADDEEVVVHAPAGSLRGRWSDGVARFAGIPFAAAPVGPLRFMPPGAPPRWDGVREARHFGPICPQNPSLMDALFGGEAERWDEDCLFLNVWTTDPSPAEPLPVMVWIHGGGFEMGSGSSPLYHGERFAHSDVVYVSINYRLGSLGFLELGGLDPALAGSGNNGLRDQVAALEWVRDNISAFGGDAGNVTIFGESAGAMSTALLMCMPSARGLFHRVVVQSGSIGSAREPERAHGDAEEFLGHLGLDPAERAATVTALRDLPVAEMLAAHGRMSAARMADPEELIARFDNPLAFLPFRPVRDGDTVPHEPLAEVAGGAAAGIPLLVGTNLEEWKLFAMMAPSPQDTEALLGRMKLLTDEPDATLAAYLAEQPGASPAEVECAALTDVVFRVPATDLADAQAPHAPVWQYRFDWRSPALGGILGAAHALEIPFVFDLVEDHRLHVLVGPEAPVELARGMHEAWVAFASGRSPEVPGAEWPARSEGTRPVLCMGDGFTLCEDPQGATRALWTELP
jgi:para-nitrobenzyl esterase